MILRIYRFVDLCLKRVAQFNPILATKVRVSNLISAVFSCINSLLFFEGENGDSLV